MEKTTSDWIDLKLDGSIDAAIRKLQKLKKQYPDGRIELGSYMEHGETYEYLRLNFTRDKEPIELEYDEWKRKLDLFSELNKAARTFAAEGMAYPRAAEIAGLKAELGAWADPMNLYRGWLVCSDGEIILQDMMRGGLRRDGTWAYRMFGADDFDKIAQGIETRSAETEGLGPKDESPVA